jgi:crotonobetainyl-CoA:carnitine CoA-transferase CaiB-like acyl-CoA transferase
MQQQSPRMEAMKLPNDNAATSSGTLGYGGKGQLSDLLVIDLSRAVAGPHAAMMLGDLGAKVIKVERPGHGDEARSWGPPFVDGLDGQPVSTYFLAANRNKASITLDLKETKDMAQLRELLVKADVLIENFRPGTLARMGLSDQALMALNPRLIVLEISGFGHDGPEGERPGYDQIAQGEAGLMSVTGPDPDDPQRVGVPIADLLAGSYGAYGVLAALHERSRTGRGQVVRTSLLAAVVASHGYQGTAWTVAGVRGQARGNHHPSIVPYGLFRCGEGVVQIACGNDAQWQKLSTEFGLDLDPDLATNPQRVERRADVIRLLEDAFSSLTTAEVLARLEAVGVPAGRVRTIDEVYAWDQTRSQGLLIDVQHASLGPIQLPGPPLRFFDVRGDNETETTFQRHEPPPPLGADNAKLNGWLDTETPLS